MGVLYNLQAKHTSYIFKGLKKRRRICKAENVFYRGLSICRKMCDRLCLRPLETSLDSLQVQQERTRGVLSTRPRNGIHLFCPQFLGKTQSHRFPLTAVEAGNYFVVYSRKERWGRNVFCFCYMESFLFIQLRIEIKMLLFCRNKNALILLSYFIGLCSIYVNHIITTKATDRSIFEIYNWHLISSQLK